MHVGSIEGHGGPADTLRGPSASYFIHIYEKFKLANIYRDKKSKWESFQISVYNLYKSKSPIRHSQDLMINKIVKVVHRKHLYKAFQSEKKQ